MGDKDIELIENYYHGRLSEMERKAVQVRLGTDNNFQKIFDQHSYLLDGAEGVKMNALSEKLRGLDQLNQSNDGSFLKAEKSNRNWPVINRRRILLMGLAAASLLAILMPFLLRTNSSITQLADQYYVSPTLDLSRKSDLSIYQKGLLEYSNGNLAGAEKSLTQIAEGDEKYYSAQYYLAHIQYESGRIDDAQLVFESLVNNPVFGEAAEWFSLLCTVKTNLNQTAIRKQANKIALKRGHFYQVKADLLLRDLIQ